MDEPIRLIQTNLRETDTGLDTKRLAGQLAEFNANTLLFGMGGIVAHYPTKVPFHYPSKYLPQGRDTFGDMLREAHARKIRVIGRFDLSKAQKPVYDAHPEWFHIQPNGQPVVYNGLYSACINGGYYKDLGKKILTEALENYPVDGLFFNMFGNQESDYSGNPVGPCQCGECKRKFQAKYGRALPAAPDDEYRQFLRDSSHETAAEIAALIHAKRPKAAFLTYIQKETDGIMSESNTAVGRALPMWPYSASDQVNRGRNSEPSKMAVNLCMSFVDFMWRFVAVPPGEIAMRLYQAMSQGGAVALNMHGTMDQEDRGALIAAKPVFAFHQQHEEFYVGQRNAARVLLLGAGGNSYRGFFRMLTELHIPFAVSDNLDWMTDKARRFDLVVAADGAPAELDGYMRAGGRVLAAGARVPTWKDLPKVAKRWDAVQGYLRIQDHAMFPSLKQTNLILLNGAFVEFEPAGKALLTLIPPAMFGPPEKVWADKVESAKPGLLVTEYGKGRLAYVPWDVGGLYYRHSQPGHVGLVADLIDHLLPSGRQLRTNAHPLVEMSLMTQPGKGRTLLHMVNVSGHSQTGYFPAIAMRDIAVEVQGEYRGARSLKMGKALSMKVEGSVTKLTLPALEAYDLIVLE